MIQEILSTEIGKKLIMLGNEAIVRGALEAGVQFVTTYPGTPASEIGDTFSVIAKQAGICFEYSVNEKVAIEAAAGASFCGLRSLTAMKHFGINVASDSLLPIAYVGTRGGMVIVVADDPNCWSSAQSEQDTRFYPRMGHIPLLEPSFPQECKEVTKFAFELSEKFEIPVIIRTTTRVSHTRSPVTLGKIVKIGRKEEFVKDLTRYNTLPPNVIKLHEKIIEKIEKIAGTFEQTKFNLVMNKGKGKFGIITSGVSFNYVMDAVDELGVKIPVLKLTTTYPLPRKRIANFMKDLKSVLVVEELEPVLEEDVKRIAQEFGIKTKVQGKDLLPRAGELTPEKVLVAISKFLNKKPRFNFDLHLKKFKKIDIPPRFPTLCPGCPYRPLFYAIKKVAGDAIRGGDIGCYMIGMFPTVNVMDFLFNMGAGEGVVHGISKATNQKTIAFIGDSTFFHAGIPALINIIYNKSNPLIVVCNNLTTAMTGEQPHPGTGTTGMGEETKTIAIEDIAKACGVNLIKIVDPYNLQETTSTIQEFLKSNEPSMIIAKHECRLMFIRRMRRLGIKLAKFKINLEKCNLCGMCLEIGCPAIHKDEKSFYIDPEICNGCGVCSRVCPVKAIEVMK